MRAAPVSPHSAPFWALYLYQTHDISPYQTRYTATDVGNLYINSGTLYQPGHTLLHFGHTMPMRAHYANAGTLYHTRYCTNKPVYLFWSSLWYFGLTEFSAKAI